MVTAFRVDLLAVDTQGVTGVDVDRTKSLAYEEMKKLTDYQATLDAIHHDVGPEIGRGTVASYIPELSRVSTDRFGMAIVPIGATGNSNEADGSGRDDQLATVGDADERFSIQSISKVFTLTLAMQLTGDDLWRRIGREPSGNPFNSLVQLEHECGIPRNPFINAGALVVTDVILSHLGNARQTVLDFVRSLAGSSTVSFDPAVAASEQATGHRNAAMAHFLKSFGNLDNPPDEVLDAYFHHCSLSMSCIDLARAVGFLANGGISPVLDEQITTPNQAKYINSLLLTCGTYDAVGDFAYRVGLPGKSGVGGGIVAVMPNAFSVAVWSPGLNASGNSLAGTKALELLTTKTGLSIF